MKKHRTDLVSLIFGMAFLAAVAWWAIARTTDTDVDLRWLVVAALAVLGAVILVSALGLLTRSGSPAPVQNTEPAEITEPVEDQVTEPEFDEDEPVTESRS